LVQQQTSTHGRYLETQVPRSKPINAPRSLNCLAKETIRIITRQILTRTHSDKLRKETKKQRERKREKERTIVNTCGMFSKILATAGLLAVANAIPTISVTGNKFFYDTGVQYYIKGKETSDHQLQPCYRAPSQLRKSNANG